MGWTGHEMKDGWWLYTRGGLHGVFIRHQDEKEKEIAIPEDLLVMLAADTVRNEKINQLEQATDKAILGLSVDILEV